MDVLAAVWYYLLKMPGEGSDLTFLHGALTARCTARVDKRFDGYHTLQFGENGGVELFYDEQRWVLDSGVAHFWTAFPGPRIRFHALPNGRGWWTHRYVAFRGPRVAQWIADGLWPDRRPQTVPGGGDPASFISRFDELIRASHSPERWANARAVNLLEGLLIDLADDRMRQPAATGPGDATWLAPLLDRLSSPHEAPEGGDDYADIARAMGMGLSTLRRRFREATGTPLHEWTMQARIARARHLLGETDLPVKVIAERLGYRDIYFFTRQFRQRVGVPPATYRRTRQS